MMINIKNPFKEIYFNYNNDVISKNNCFPLNNNNLITLNTLFNEEDETNENNLYNPNTFYIEKNDSSISVENYGIDSFNFEKFSKNQNSIQNELCLDKKDIFTFKKNRNNFNINSSEDINNSLETYFEKTQSINNNSSINISNLNNQNYNNSSLSIRCDSLLIKFKSVLGKWFILNLNSKIKNIIKRKLKFFSFNYKKFTIIVSYSKNKRWLDEKIKDLLILGDEPNQSKNKKALKSLYKKKFEELNEIKDILEQTYRNIIKQFYLTEEFINFKNDKRVIELNDYFIKIMNISILENEGFIKFLECRKGNIRKK